jgi:hypothetical protein
LLLKKIGQGAGGLGRRIFRYHRANDLFSTELTVMYIIALGWMFVVVLMAAAEAMASSVVGGLLTLFFYGIFPLGLFLYVFGTPQRRRNQVSSSQTTEAIRPETPSRRNE